MPHGIRPTRQAPGGSLGPMDTPARSPRAAARAVGRGLQRWPGRRGRDALVTLVLCFLAAAIVAAPVALVRAIEGVRFEDQLGTLPVEVSLCHDGRSTLDTGVFGKVFWDRTGAYGFGAYARASGPPEAGGTLASYVDPAFIEANVSFIRDPDTVIATYSAEMRTALWDHVLRDELVAALVGGTILFLVLPRRRLRGVSRGHAAVASVLLVNLAFGLSVMAAAKTFSDWECSAESGATFTVPGMENPTFSSPQMSEIVAQVQPFVDKNTRRIDEEADRYEQAASASLTTAFRQAGGLAPRDGEKVVLAEADPQGSFVGVQVRTAMYDALVDLLGDDAVALRTISGDVTSNGTVAESAFVKAEAKVGEGIPVAAVGGDHDSEKTWAQMEDAGFALPDLDTVEVGGLQVSGAHDREHKTLFGGSITNMSGISEQELGRRLREEVGDRAGVVLLHQPSALAGYLGTESLTDLRAVVNDDTTRTTPYDDGVPDQPPGTVNVGHLHDPAGPWVLWNTEGEAVTWTVVDQLGTAGGVENAPTFSRFSTPVSPPLKPIMVRLQYVHAESGLQTGYATVTCGLDAACSVTERVEVGLPGGQPGRLAGN